MIRNDNRNFEKVEADRKVTASLKSLLFMKKLISSLILSFWLVFFFLHASVTSAAKDRFLVLQIGLERQETELVDDKGKSMQAQNQADYQASPVFRFASSSHLFGCLGKASDPYFGGTDLCALGFAIRAVGGQRRSEGKWYPTEKATPNYYYRTVQIAAELTMGIVYEFGADALSIGLRGGLNNYDLIIKEGEQLFYEKYNKTSLYLSSIFQTAPLLLLSAILNANLTLPIGNLYFSLEQTLPGYNEITVKNLNNGADLKVDLQSTIGTIFWQYGF